MLTSSGDAPSDTCWHASGGVEKECMQVRFRDLLATFFFGILNHFGTQVILVGQIILERSWASKKTYQNLGNSWTLAEADRILCYEAFPLTQLLSFALLHLVEFYLIKSKSTVPKIGKPMAKREKIVY